MAGEWGLQRWAGCAGHRGSSRSHTNELHANRSELDEPLFRKKSQPSYKRLLPRWAAKQPHPPQPQSQTHSQTQRPPDLLWHIRQAVSHSLTPPQSCKTFPNLKPNTSGSHHQRIILRHKPNYRRCRGNASGLMSTASLRRPGVRTRIHFEFGLFHGGHAWADFGLAGFYSTCLGFSPRAWLPPNL